MKKISFAVIICFICTFFLISCSRVNNDNYRKIAVGMQYSQVIAILGNPTQCNAVLNAKDCSWGSRSKSIDIKFVGDKVIFFSSSGL